VTAALTAITPHVRFNEPLSGHTTFRVGGPAHYFVDAQNLHELRQLRELCRAKNIPLLLLGGGSNVLVSDEGFPGLVLRLAGDFARHRFEGEELHAGAGALMPMLVRKALDHELSGLECLAGVPGTLGGAVVGNAGSAEEWIGTLIESVDVLGDTGSTLTLPRRDLSFSYRSSSLAGRIVLGAVLRLKKAQKNDILLTINDRMLRRSERQPAGAWCAGSVFKNPPGSSAGKLIEEAGLKGLSFGGARVSEKHANFVVNTGNATASDIKTLITMVRHKIQERSGITLELEIKVIGR
jgi:UDP-N-acetylmuramate dehydrogenase